MAKDIQVRNSVSDFLIFTKQTGGDGIQVRLHDENIWLTQKSMAQLFDCSIDNIALHLKNIFQTGELDEMSTTEDSSVVQKEGERNVSRNMKFYNLDAVISVGYRINSVRATQFRKWATDILKQFTIKGYLLDKTRLENGQIFDEDYFDHLLDEIREIRASERKFYQKITDIYATASDYSPNSIISKTFFATVQNKLHYAIHGSTAAEVIYTRADHQKKIQMTMEDWAKKLDVFLEFNEEAILTDKGKVSTAIAKSFAETEFEKYRIIQDKTFVSDFDKYLAELENTISG
nr:RhuM family protein [uncultured Treponema sp.]